MEKICDTCKYDLTVWNGSDEEKIEHCKLCVFPEFGGWAICVEDRKTQKHHSDGSTASYYELPEGATELQDIISFLNCNAQMGEIGRAWMRYGRCPHSPKIRDIKKIIFYAQAELDRLEKYEKN